MPLGCPLRSLPSPPGALVDVPWKALSWRSRGVDQTFRRQGQTFWLSWLLGAGQAVAHGRFWWPRSAPQVLLSVILLVVPPASEL